MRVGLSFTDAMHDPSGLRRNYTHVPVTSVSLAVDPSGRYEGFPHFVSFAERIKWVLWGQAHWRARPGKQTGQMGFASAAVASERWVDVASRRVCGTCRVWVRSECGMLTQHRLHELALRLPTGLWAASTSPRL